jgi:hypothetical protein
MGICKSCANPTRNAVEASEKNYNFSMIKVQPNSNLTRNAVKASEKNYSKKKVQPNSINRNS